MLRLVRRREEARGLPTRMKIALRAAEPSRRLASAAGATATCVFTLNFRKTNCLPTFAFMPSTNDV